MLPDRSIEIIYERYTSVDNPERVFTFIETNGTHELKANLITEVFRAPEKVKECFGLQAETTLRIATDPERKKDFLEVFITHKLEDVKAARLYSQSERVFVDVMFSTKFLLRFEFYSHEWLKTYYPEFYPNIL